MSDYRPTLDEVALDNPRTRSFDESPWVTPAMAAHAFARSEQTIRTWMRTGEVRSLCLRANHRIVVYWPDVSRVTTTRARRLRSRSSAA